MNKSYQVGDVITIYWTAGPETVVIVYIDSDGEYFHFDDSEYSPHGYYMLPINHRKIIESELVTGIKDRYE